MRLQGIASDPHRHLARKLQLPLNRLEARLLAQGSRSGSVFTDTRPGSRSRSAVSSHSTPSPDCPTAHRSWRSGTPRHRPVLPSVSQARLPHLRAGRACHRSPRGTLDSTSGPAWSRMRCACSADPEPIIGELAMPVGVLVVGLKTGDLRKSRNSACHSRGSTGGGVRGRCAGERGQNAGKDPRWDSAGSPARPH